jgi:hypothetical protein
VLANARDNDRNRLVEPQQGFDITMVPVSVRAADRLQIQPSNVEGFLWRPEFSAQQWISQDRRIGRLKQ